MKVSIDEIKVRNRFRKDIGDLTSLIDSIKAYGLLHPIIITPEKELICGMRRIAAFKAMGDQEIECRILDFEDLIYGERDENICRQDFTLSEKVAITEAIEEMEKEKAKERQKEAGKIFGRGKDKIASENFSEAIENENERRAKTRSARSVGISRPTLAKAQEVVEAAKTNPEYAEIVEKMDKTGKVSASHKELLRRKEAERALERSKQIEDENIFVGDFRSVEIEHESVSLIFTDPPYSKDKISLFSDLAAFGNKVLKEGGSLMCFTPQYALPEIIQLAGEHLKYWWIIACKHEGESARLYGWHVRIGWKPILWFVKGTLPNECPMVSDFVQSRKPDKTKHPWAQSLEEAKYYIELLTYPDELVCDPFLGSGTTCLAAKLLGRKYLGIEKDKAAADIAKVNINEHT